LFSVVIVSHRNCRSVEVYYRLGYNAVWCGRLLPTSRRITASDESWLGLESGTIRKRRFRCTKLYSVSWKG
jgi:hypothetical protein